MTRLSKFLSLRAGDRRLLLKTLLLVWIVRLGLWLLPFRVLRHLLANLALKPVASKNCSADAVTRDVWAVTLACRYVPAATCLTQALVTKLLLGRHGQCATVRIGVARAAGGELQAHAWVESGGRIVIGGSELSVKNYTPLAATNGDLW